MKKVVVGLSGGVDSAVSAFLLKAQGYEVIGLFMRNWDSFANNDILGNPNVEDDICPQEKDYQDALKVAEYLNIPLYRKDFVKEYWDHVFTYFIEEHKNNRTPNPDILCNKYVKFASFQEEARKLGADYFAYGHYARKKESENEIFLLRGIDNLKDQSYFLCQLNQEQLKNSLFPVGELTKKQVRDIAKSNQIPTANKKDSTGICFIGERNFRDFLKNYLFTKPGNIETLNREILGFHEGLMYYTIGQRKGLNIGGDNRFKNSPWFVVGKDIERNVLLVGQGINHPHLYSNRIIVDDVNWISPVRFSGWYECTAKFRYRQTDNLVRIRWIDEFSLEVICNKPTRATTPGQAAVFYNDEVCLGGGTIRSVFQNQNQLKY